MILYLYSDLLRARYSALSIRYGGTIANVIAVLMIDLINKTKQKKYSKYFSPHNLSHRNTRRRDVPGKFRILKTIIKYVVLYH